MFNVKGGGVVSGKKDVRFFSFKNTYTCIKTFIPLKETMCLEHEDFKKIKKNNLLTDLHGRLSFQNYQQFNDEI